jgi:type IV secretory pathway TrbL component
MKNLFILVLLTTLLTNCNNEQASMKESEQQLIDSLLKDEQNASDSLMKAIQSEIGEQDSTLLEEAE